MERIFSRGLNEAGVWQVTVLQTGQTSQNAEQMLMEGPTQSMGWAPFHEGNKGHFNHILMGVCL